MLNPVYGLAESPRDWTKAHESTNQEEPRHLCEDPKKRLKCGRYKRQEGTCWPCEDHGHGHYKKNWWYGRDSSTVSGSQEDPNARSSSSAGYKTENKTEDKTENKTETEAIETGKHKHRTMRLAIYSRNLAAVVVGSILDVADVGRIVELNYEDKGIEHHAVKFTIGGKTYELVIAGMVLMLVIICVGMKLYEDVQKLATALRGTLTPAGGAIPGPDLAADRDPDYQDMMTCVYHVDTRKPKVVHIFPDCGKFYKTSSVARTPICQICQARERDRLAAKEKED